MVTEATQIDGVCEQWTEQTQCLGRGGKGRDGRIGEKCVRREMTTYILADQVNDEELGGNCKSS